MVSRRALTCSSSCLAVTPELYRVPAGRRDHHRVDVIADDRHPVIGFARSQDFLKIGERDCVAGYRAIAWEARQRRLRGQLLLLAESSEARRTRARTASCGEGLGKSCKRASSMRLRST